MMRAAGRRIISFWRVRVERTSWTTAFFCVGPVTVRPPDTKLFFRPQTLRLGQVADAGVDSEVHNEFFRVDLAFDYAEGVVQPLVLLIRAFENGG